MWKRTLPKFNVEPEFNQPDKSNATPTSLLNHHNSSKEICSEINLSWVSSQKKLVLKLSPPISPALKQHYCCEQPSRPPRDPVKQKMACYLESIQIYLHLSISIQSMISIHIYPILSISIQSMIHIFQLLQTDFISCCIENRHVASIDPHITCPQPNSCPHTAQQSRWCEQHTMLPQASFRTVFWKNL